MAGMSNELQMTPTAPSGRWDDDLPFGLDDHGAGVADLQRRLARLGYWIGEDELGRFGPGTVRAVEEFQRDRGLRQSGTCTPDTWSTLVEASFSLGDRLLYRRNPMLHGDDVADLQRRLSSLGFDPKGVDGIFGDLTAAALADFQHNIGIADDAICGPRTLAELSRLSIRRGGEDLVTSVREGLRFRANGKSLQNRIIAVGEPGGFQTGSAALVRSLTTLGAHSITLHHPDESEQASEANSSNADCYLGLRLEPERRGVRTIYYRGYRYESETSKQLAQLILARIVDTVGLENEGVAGMALPVLRRTRMPAVVVELGNPSLVAMRAQQLATAVSDGLLSWLDAIAG